MYQKFIFFFKIRKKKKRVPLVLNILCIDPVYIMAFLGFMLNQEKEKKKEENKGAILKFKSFLHDVM